eukprot:CAMPEP_0114480148 /NCGR_PEP_ID=MMETSP0104-20121206/16974_1 /TAXON_ID=37642 ORGANISM="Paraphysomonas imperforata, Strain PA2" /NCGR_SAMPLE_ID=MMETSP0104 /ASSEMBLY_ACC=CAM_ASM_000202 /LENGTH=81 /DNA_ID=CAMNT_0001655607 /DNA_START=118 /DNA_END=360 /DNA_ORIENTATION=+
MSSSFMHVDNDLGNGDNERNQTSDNYVILRPGEYFNAAIQVRRIGNNAVETDAVKRLDGIFPIQRCHDRGVNYESERNILE